MTRDLNLIPPAFIEKQISTRSNILGGVLFALWILILVGLYGASIAVIAASKQTLEAKKKELNEALRQVAELDRLIKERDKLENRERIIRELIKHSSESKIDWAEVLKNISSDIPDGVWLTDVDYQTPDLIKFATSKKISADNLFMLHGLADSHLLIAKFMENMKRHGFENVDFQFATRTKDKKLVGSNIDSAIEYKIISNIARKAE